MAEAKKSEIPKQKKSQYPEGVHYFLNNSGIHLKISLSNPTLGERKAYEEGTIQYGYAIIKEVVFFLFRFGECPWIDIPYSVHINESSEIVRQLLQNRSAAIYMELINAKNSVLISSRKITPNNCFFDTIGKKLLNQTISDYDSYCERVKEAYALYSIDEMVKMGEITVCNQ
ncbi:hypothetical protein [Eubacterium sp.]|uniref:hypothetical protein n=1 Tax=Eubacterium sp. TaxID=142586 RepID=UPI0026DECDA5|nr:hypothetical protein [Eubacterium sp.]MDO5432913.1 hypothetical protein [Eubacterium sp.]